MKLHSLDLKNFRCFAQLRVEFHPQLTVLVANNGQGKTAILDALRIGLWSFLSGFDLANPNTTIPTTNNISSNSVTTGILNLLCLAIFHTLLYLVS